MFFDLNNNNNEGDQRRYPNRPQYDHVPQHTLSEAGKMLRGALSPQPINSSQLPEGFKQHFEIHVVTALAEALAVHMSNVRPDNPVVLVNIDLTEDLNLTISNYIDEYKQGYVERRDGYRHRHHPDTDDSLVFYNCGLKNILERLGLDPCASAVYSNHSGRHTTYKIEIEVEVSRLLQSIDEYIDINYHKEQNALDEKRSNECYEWLKDLVERNRKQTDFIVEIQSDIKMLLGYAKDSMGELNTIKTKLEALWTEVRKKLKVSPGAKSKDEPHA